MNEITYESLRSAYDRVAKQMCECGHIHEKHTLLTFSEDRYKQVFPISEGCSECACLNFSELIN